MPSRQELVAQAEASLELQRRHLTEKIRFYVPCSDKHKAFHLSTKPIRAIFGGNRSGKSVAGLVELLFHACFKKHPYTGIENPRSGHYRIFTTKFQIAEELIIPMMQEWIPLSWYRGGSWSNAYDPRYHLLHGKDGSLIDILTYDQDASVAESVNLHGAWMDEEAPEKIYSGTVARIMSTKGFIVLTVTPLYSMSWALRIWRAAGTPTVDVFRLGIVDNPHLPQEYIKDLVAQWPENERAARENGDFLEFSGLVYKELDDHIHLLNDWKAPTTYCPVVCSVDPHPRKPTVVTWAMVTPGESLVFFDELEIAGSARDIVRAIKEKESRHVYPTQMRLIDPAANKQVSGIGSALTTLGEFENAGMGFTLADNSEAGYNVVHEYLAYDKSRSIDNFNHPRLFFTDRVPKTWQGMKELLWDEFRFKDMHDPKERVKDYKKDFPDCVRYTVAQKPTVDSSEMESVELRAQIYGN